VRHPMYAAPACHAVGVPISLGSWWSALILVAIRCGDMAVGWTEESSWSGIGR